MAITLDEMKKYLRVDFTDDDALIEKLISEAKNRCLDILRIEAAKKATLDTSSISIAIQQIIANSRRNGTSLHSPAE